MKNKEKTIPEHSSRKAGTGLLNSDIGKLKTDQPLAEKDEVKKAEEDMYKRLNKKEDHTVKNKSYKADSNKRPHMLFN